MIVSSEHGTFFALNEKSEYLIELIFDIESIDQNDCATSYIKRGYPLRSKHSLYFYVIVEHVTIVGNFSFFV